jgi:hypothetical protein
MLGVKKEKTASRKGTKGTKIHKEENGFNLCAPSSASWLSVKKEKFAKAAAFNQPGFHHHCLARE